MWRIHRKELRNQTRTKRRENEIEEIEQIMKKQMPLLICLSEMQVTPEILKKELEIQQYKRVDINCKQ